MIGQKILNLLKKYLKRIKRSKKMVTTVGVEEKFFQLLQIAVGKQVTKKIELSDEEWNAIYKIACMQSLVAVVFSSADVLSGHGLKPPMNLLFQWIGDTELIRQQNRIINQHCEQLTSWFKNAGFSSCILKGQGVARLYNDSELRQAGDIDIWVDANRDVIVKKMRSDCLGVTYVDYVNCHVSFFIDTEVEVHFRPTWMFNPITNRKVQKWIREHKDEQMANFDKTLGFSYPTIAFNLVFSLIHIYRHVFFEGIGLRQLMDYYFILSHSNEEERAEAYVTLRSFGIDKFVGTVMHVLRRVFNLDDSLLLCKPNVEEGEFLLSEIMRGGNFGHFDDRNIYVSDENRLLRGLNNTKRNMRFLMRYPSEVLWMPVWKTWHWGWRKWKGYL